MNNYSQNYFACVIGVDVAKEVLNKEIDNKIDLLKFGENLNTEQVVKLKRLIKKFF